MNVSTQSGSTAAALVGSEGKNVDSEAFLKFFNL